MQKVVQGNQKRTFIHVCYLSKKAGTGPTGPIVAKYL